MSTLLDDSTLHKRVLGTARLHRLPHEVTVSVDRPSNSNADGLLGAGGKLVLCFELQPRPAKAVMTQLQT